MFRSDTRKKVNKVAAVKFQLVVDDLTTPILQTKRRKKFNALSYYFLYSKKLTKMVSPQKTEPLEFMMKTFTSKKERKKKVNFA